MLVVGAAVLFSAACGRSAFVPYAPTADLVPPLADPASIHLGAPEIPGIYADCDARELRTRVEPGPNASEWRAVGQILYQPEERSRVVWFATERFGSRGDYDKQMKKFGDWFSEPCVASDDPGRVEVEPTELDGLPDGNITARWPSKHGEAWSTVIGDRDRRLVMTVVWDEDPANVPVDSFVEAVNTAWSEFESANP